MELLLQVVVFKKIPAEAGCSGVSLSPAEAEGTGLGVQLRLGYIRSPQGYIRSPQSSRTMSTVNNGSVAIDLSTCMHLNIWLMFCNFTHSLNPFSVTVMKHLARQSGQHSGGRNWQISVSHRPAGSTLTLFLKNRLDRQTDTQIDT